LRRLATIKVFLRTAAELLNVVTLFMAFYKAVTSASGVRCVAIKAAIVLVLAIAGLNDKADTAKWSFEAVDVQNGDFLSGGSGLFLHFRYSLFVFADFFE